MVEGDIWREREREGEERSSREVRLRKSEREGDGERERERERRGGREGDEEGGSINTLHFPVQVCPFLSPLFFSLSLSFSLSSLLLSYSFALSSIG